MIDLAGSTTGLLIKDNLFSIFYKLFLHQSLKIFYCTYPYHIYIPVLNFVAILAMATRLTKTIQIQLQKHYLVRVAFLLYIHIVTVKTS